MTACDLGAITKPWEIQKKVAKKIEDEFYFQVVIFSLFIQTKDYFSSEGWFGENWVERSTEPNDGSAEERRIPFPPGERETKSKKNKINGNRSQVGYVDFICEPLYEHLVHQEHLEYLKHLAPKDGNNIENNGAIFTNLDPMLEGDSCYDDPNNME